jgi:hypothetical protein
MTRVTIVVIGIPSNVLLSRPVCIAMAKRPEYGTRNFIRPASRHVSRAALQHIAMDCPGTASGVIHHRKNTVHGKG